jgi:hypothetical protein
LDYAKNELFLKEEDVQFLLSDAKATDAMAGDQFEQSWEVVPPGTPESSKLREEYSKLEGDVGIAPSSQKPASAVIEDISLGAIKTMEKLQEKMSGVTDIMEQRKLRKDPEYRVYRLGLTFLGDEANMVQETLGEKPSEKFLALCKAEYDEMVKRGEIVEEEIEA